MFLLSLTVTLSFWLRFVRYWKNISTTLLPLTKFNFPFSWPNIWSFISWLPGFYSIKIETWKSCWIAWVLCWRKSSCLGLRICNHGIFAWCLTWYPILFFYMNMLLVTDHWSGNWYKSSSWLKEGREYKEHNLVQCLIGCSGWELQLIQPKGWSTCMKRSNLQLYTEISGPAMCYSSRILKLR